MPGQPEGTGTGASSGAGAGVSGAAAAGAGAGAGNGNDAGASAQGHGSGQAASGDGSSDTPLQRSPLAMFLIRRACRSLPIATYLHWYATVETSDPRSGQLYNDFLAALFAELPNSAEGRAMETKLMKQAEISMMILGAVADCKKMGPKSEKKRRLNESLEPHGQYGKHLSNIRGGVHLPLDPRVVLVGTEPGKCKVFSSAIYPVLIPMRVDHTKSIPGWHLTSTMRFKAEAKARAAAASGQAHGGAAAGGASEILASAAGSAVGSVTTTLSRSTGSSDSAALPPPPTYDVIFKIGDDMR